MGDMVVDEEGGEKTIDDPFHKTRPCKFVVDEETCPFGDSCHFAHSLAELRPAPAWAAPPAAAHWQGRHVRIGVVEQALFWDLPPVGTVDVLCNRASCLGNPFAQRLYAIGEPEPCHDAEGWCPQEHRELCAAFTEYLSAVLGKEQGSTESLFPLVQGISRRRSMEMAGSWLAQRLRFCDVQAALEGVVKRIQAGDRVRLLCHCRPHVRCHTEDLMAYLEAQVKCRDGANGQEPGCAGDAEPPWPRTNAEFCPMAGPRCAGGRCGRAGRAMDPGDLRLYCSRCWLRQSEYLKNMGVALAIAPEAADKIIEAYWENRRQGPPGVEAPADALGRCLFHLRGSCKFGSECFFAHAAAEDSDGPQPCRFFWHGVCRFGDACSFSHDRRPAPSIFGQGAAEDAAGATPGDTAGPGGA